MNRPAKSGPVAAVILAAGKGARMKSATPKVLHAIGGRSMLAHVIACAAALSPRKMSVVIGDSASPVGEAAKAERADIEIAVQAPPRGTGDAVKKALPALEGFEGAVVILYADTPLVEPATIAALIDAVNNDGAVSVLGFRPFEGGAYGRLKLGEDGALEAIIEANDASAEELEIELCNSGVMAMDAAFLRGALAKLTPDNAKKEYYLTDIVAIARSEGKDCVVVEADEDEVIGVNSRAELSIAEEIFQDRRRLAAMDAGVTLIDPAAVYFSHDTVLGEDVTVEPNVFFGPGVTIGDGALIRGFSHLEGAHVGARAVIGPFARLRPGARVGAAARIGNFVEIKNAAIGDGAKVNHLSYIGDASLGEDANIGAGTITCNYDGFNKHKTEIGAGAFIGSNASLVAPVKIGDGAYVGSGSVITKDVAAGDLGVARGRQKAIKGWAARFRKANKK